MKMLTIKQLENVKLAVFVRFYREQRCGFGYREAHSNEFNFYYDKGYLYHRCSLHSRYLPKSRQKMYKLNVQEVFVLKCVHKCL